MAKIARNAPCPCGSGKKYKKCCLLHQGGAKRHTSKRKIRFIPVYTELDQLSNNVVDLIKKSKLDEAEAVSRKLLAEYPDQVDGLNRLAMVYEARGEKRKAAEYYRKAADFAKSNEGFDRKIIKWFLSEAKRVESGELNRIKRTKRVFSSLLKKLGII
jgi:tetratricopeptide (TPR) repeat protein